MNTKERDLHKKYFHSLTSDEQQAFLANREARRQKAAYELAGKNEQTERNANYVKFFGIAILAVTVTWTGASLITGIIATNEAAARSAAPAVTEATPTPAPVAPRYVNPHADQYAPIPTPTPETPAPAPTSDWRKDFQAADTTPTPAPAPVEVAAPTPAPTPEMPAPAPEITAPRATPVIHNNYVPANQLPGYHGEGAANAALRQEVPAPRAISVQDPANFVMSVLRNYNRHDYLALAPYLVSGHLNYFGHREATDAFIRHDMANDVRTYAGVNCTFQPETFKHEVSNEYSSHWEGPMVYDSITAYTEAREFNGKVHSATTRFTVGYTSVNGVTKIYAMVDKVL